MYECMDALSNHLCFKSTLPCREGKVLFECTHLLQSKMVLALQSMSE